MLACASRQHHVYPGNRADAGELPEALSLMGALLDRNRIARDSVTLVLTTSEAVPVSLSPDKVCMRLRQWSKGSAALTNTLELGLVRRIRGYNPVQAVCQVNGRERVRGSGRF